MTERIPVDREGAIVYFGSLGRKESVYEYPDMLSFSCRVRAFNVDRGNLVYTRRDIGPLRWSHAEMKRRVPPVHGLKLPICR